MNPKEEYLIQWAGMPGGHTVKIKLEKVLNVAKRANIGRSINYQRDCESVYKKLLEAFPGYYLGYDTSGKVIDELEVERYCRERLRGKYGRKPCAPATLRKELAIAHGAIEEHRRISKIPLPNPFCFKGLNVREIRKKPSPRERVMTLEERDVILGSLQLDPKHRNLIWFMYWMAFRVEEVLGARWEHISGTRICKPEGTHKTWSKLDFHLWQEAQKVLDRTPNTGKYIFTGENKMLYKRLGKWWRDEMKRLGIEGLQMRDLRKSRLQEVARDYGIQVAQAVAGHASISTTLDSYAPTSADWAEKAEMENLSRKLA